MTLSEFVCLMATVGFIGILIAVSRSLHSETVPAPESAQTISFQELHNSAHLDNLPVHHIHNQAVVFAGPAPNASGSPEGSALPD